MSEETEKQFGELVKALDADVEDFEDLLDGFEDQNKKMAVQLPALIRQLDETRTELGEMREMIETLTQKLDRLTAMVQSRMTEPTP